MLLVKIQQIGLLMAHFEFVLIKDFFKLPYISDLQSSSVDDYFLLNNNTTIKLQTDFEFT
jgi:hypothetical protein